MLRLRVALAVAAVAFTVEAAAQYDVHFSHYYDMETSFNPGATGKDTKLNVSAAYAMSMVGFENNPQTAYISGDMPIMIMNSMHGVGLQFMNDKLGLFNHMRISAQYSAKLRMMGGLLGIGIQAGLLTEKFDGTKVDVGDEGDPAIPKTDVNGNALDLSAGIYYKVKDFYAGLSAAHLTAPTVRLGEVNEIKIKPTYYATAGYTFNLRNPMLQVKTSALGRTDGATWRADLTGRLIYTTESKKFYSGLTYSPTTSVTLLLGTTIRGINVGYSYEYYTGGMNMANGSHELHVGYQMDLNLVKKGKNMHKAVRIL